MKKWGIEKGAINSIIEIGVIRRAIKRLIICIVMIIFLLSYGLTTLFNVPITTGHYTRSIITGGSLKSERKGVFLMSWHAKPTGGYNIYSTEGVENGMMIYYQMRAAGWTTEAISAVVGNICAEGGLNPWRWQSDIIVGPDDFWDRTHGYGLAGFTPAGKYIEDTDAQGYPGYAPNYLNHPGNATDGAAQIKFIMENPQYYQTHAAYPLTFQEFSQSTESPSYLSDTWLYNFEQPAHPEDTQEYRRDCSNYFYEIFSGAPYISDGDIIPCLVAMKIIK